MGWITKVYADVYHAALMQDGYWVAGGKDAIVPAMEKLTLIQRLFRRG